MEAYFTILHKHYVKEVAFIHYIVSIAVAPIFRVITFQHGWRVAGARRSMFTSRRQLQLSYITRSPTDSFLVNLTTVLDNFTMEEYTDRCGGTTDIVEFRHFQLCERWVSALLLLDVLSRTPTRNHDELSLLPSPPFIPPT